jgi:hypothetical protein
LKKEKEHCWNGPRPFDHGLPGPPRGAFWPEAEAGEVFSPVGTGRPTGSGGVAGEQASGVTDRFGGQREGTSSSEGFFAAKGIGGWEETTASWSRGHQRGLSGWGECTRRYGAWGGVETVGGWLEWAVRSGLVRPERNDSGGVEE